VKLCGFAIYSVRSATIFCTDTLVEVPRKFPSGAGVWHNGWVCIGDVADLDAKCTGHKHDNKDAIVSRFDDWAWTDADEVGAVTVHP
jgi:hypothetical protein